MTFSNRDRERMLQGLATAADPVPWRCSACNRAVRPHRNDPCACHPVTDREWDGREATIGTSVPPHAVTPRLVGPAVEHFKRMWGVCMEEGCKREAGHRGEHTEERQS